MTSKTPLHIVILVLLSVTGSFAQVQKNGYNGTSWGTDKSKVTGILECNSSFAGENYENCSVKSDSLIFGKYPYLFLNYRFYNQKFVEVNIDIERSRLAYLVAELTTKYGSPSVKEKMDQSNNRNNSFTFYEWIYGDSKIVIFDKGINLPIWCTVTSIKHKKTRSNEEEEIQKLLFEQ